MPSSAVSRPVVLVTGAARRVGRAIAHDLAAHGFDIALHYRRSHDEAEATAVELRALGARAQCFAADLGDESACRALVPAVVAAMGRLDALVNNAAHFEYDNAETFSYAAMETHWRANTAPAVVLAQALALHLKGCSETGCVVNLSDQKLWNPNPDYLSYTLSKAALEAATTLLAQALAPQVRVVGVAPGVTMVSGTAMDDASFQRARRMTPLGRSSTPQDVARSVRFALESGAITGTTILVDGGQHLAAQPRDVAFLTTPKAASPRPLEGRGLRPGKARSAAAARIESPRPTMHSLLIHPALMDCRRLFLRDYEVWINIGVHDFEKRGEQRVLINVDLFVPLAQSTPQADKLDEVLDYDFIRRSISARVSRGHIHLQETLADDVLKLMLAHPHVRAARVSTAKPDVYPDCDAVGVEVFGLKDAKA